AAVADFAKALPQVEGTWSDVAILLLSEDPTPSGVWEELAAKARRLCQGLKLDLEVPKELGFLWTPDFRPASLSLGAAKPEEELVDPATAATPEQRAILLVRGACSAESLVDAAKDAKEALSIFRDLGHRIGEATALLAVSRATVDSDLQGAQSAANQAMKLFREMGHQKGRAYAMQAAAEADKIRHNSDDAVFKANEAKKLADLMGDRALEFALCETVVDANITQDKAGHAVEAAKDAQELAVSLNDQ
ncbi:tetA, partial [Symbiodinium pilosum]